MNWVKRILTKAISIRLLYVFYREKYNTYNTYGSAMRKPIIISEKFRGGTD